MLKTLIMLLVIVPTLLMAGNLYSGIFVLNTISETVSRFDLNTKETDNTFAVTGMYPNKMAVNEKHLFLTNSGDANVQVIDIHTGETVKKIEMEEFSNPYDILIHGSYLYVTGMLSNKVYRIDKQSLEIVAEVEVGISPMGLLAAEEILYVANSGVSYPDYHAGELSVIDLESFAVVDEVELPTNAQRMAFCNNDRLHIVCTGDYDEITGQIVVLERESLEKVDSITFGNYPINILIPSNNRAYTGDAFNLGVFSYDVTTFEPVHTPENRFAAGGGAFLELDEYIIVADAKDFTSNSTISFYSLDEEFLFSFDSAIGAVDLAKIPVSANIEDNLLTPQVNIYPNPSQGSFHIDVAQLEGVKGSSPSEYVNYTVEIFNIKGQLINRINLAANQTVWDGTCAGNRPVPSGIYFMKINQADAATKKRITIIR